MAAPRVHPTADVEAGATLGDDTVIWRFCHVRSGAQLGNRVSVGQGCYLGNVRIGDGCRIQNHVSVYDGVTLEDDVFLGPSCVFTNVKTPRAHVSRHGDFLPTLIEHGASIGANATIVCGITIGRYAMVGAGAVVRADVPAHAVVVGVPARILGWACICGQRLRLAPTICGPTDAVCGCGAVAHARPAAKTGYPELSFTNPASSQ